MVCRCCQHEEFIPSADGKEVTDPKDSHSSGCFGVCGMQGRGKLWQSELFDGGGGSGCIKEAGGLSRYLQCRV